MHWTREKLFDFFDSNEIAVQKVQHHAVFTMAESAGLNLNLPGIRCKNLLVQNKKGSSRYLIVTPADTAVDLGELGKLLGSGRLSLCPASQMTASHGVAPGAMSPFSLIADKDAKQIQLIMDTELMSATHFQFHPLVNTETVAISQEGFARFLNAVEHQLRHMLIPKRAVCPTAAGHRDAPAP